MDTYLEDHPPARSQFRATRRAEVSGACVLHTAESNTDVSPPDSGAENVARFIARRPDPGSYHAICDSDSTVHLGRYEWEMFGEATGGNRWALHLSWACQAHQWPSLPVDWVRGAIEQGAHEAARMAAWVHTTTGVRIPARRITAAEYRDAKPGFIAHGDVDPDRRTDPGPHFPWEVFLDRFSELTDWVLNEPPVADFTLPGNRDETIRRVQRALASVGFYTGRIDGDPYVMTAEAAEALARAYAGLSGSVRATRAGLESLLDALAENG